MKKILNFTEKKIENFNPCVPADYMIFIVNRLREIIESEIVTADYEQIANHKPPFLQIFESFQIKWRTDPSLGL